jgi:hypothetical protein
VAHILLATEKEANDVVAKLKEGADLKRRRRAEALNVGAGSQPARTCVAPT